MPKEGPFIDFKQVIKYMQKGKTGYQLIVSIKRRYCVHPIMHCFKCDILYRWSGELLVMKHILTIKSYSSLVFQSFFVTNDPHDHLFKISYWKQCIMGSARHLLLCLVPYFRYKNLDCISDHMKTIQGNTKKVYPWSVCSRFVVILQLQSNGEERAFVHSHDNQH